MKTRAENLLSLNARPTSSQVLYHYCSGDVLWSIIRNGSIWLSDILTLNDTEELKWGRDVFFKVLLDNHMVFNDDFRDFAIYMVCTLLRDDPVGALHGASIGHPEHRAFGMLDGARPFVGSFSANGDLLSQWRAYADDGKGFSLGLRASHIHKKWGVRLKRLEYRKARQEAIIKQSLVEMHDIWRKTGAHHFPKKKSFALYALYSTRMTNILMLVQGRREAPCRLR